MPQNALAALLDAISSAPGTIERLQCSRTLQVLLEPHDAPATLSWYHATLILVPCCLRCRMTLLDVPGRCNSPGCCNCYFWRNRTLMQCSWTLQLLVLAPQNAPATLPYAVTAAPGTTTLLQPSQTYQTRAQIGSSTGLGSPLGSLLGLAGEGFREGVVVSNLVPDMPI